MTEKSDKHLVIGLSLAVVGIAVLNCSAPGPEVTQLAATVQGLATESATEPAASDTSPTETLPSVASTSAPEETAETACTLDASFAADVTVPDDTEFPSDTPFVKTWRIENSGWCDWTEGFTLTFVDGDQMGGEPSVAVPPTAAGSTVEVSVNLIAPTAPGAYRGNWQMVNDDGTSFGDRFYVQVVVPAPPTPTPVPTAPPPEPTVIPTEEEAYYGTGIVIPLMGSEGTPYLRTRDRQGYQPCAVFDFNGAGFKTVAIDGFPACVSSTSAGFEVKVYDASQGWIEGEVSGLRYDPVTSLLTFTAQRDGIGGIFIKR